MEWCQYLHRFGFSKNSSLKFHSSHSLLFFVIALLLTKSIIALILARVSLTRMKKYQPGLLLPRTKILFSIIALEYPEGPRKNREIRNAVLKSRRFERAHKNATL